MNPHYPSVALRARHRCEYCHAPEVAFNSLFEVEHIVPQSREGSNEFENLALSCRSCNGFKSARQMGTDPETHTEVPLFHPRFDTWEDHFRVETETLAIHGQTPTGRATLVALRRNSAAQLTARRQWHRLDLFP